MIERRERGWISFERKDKKLVQSLVGNEDSDADAIMITIWSFNTEVKKLQIVESNLGEN